MTRNKLDKLLTEYVSDYWGLLTQRDLIDEILKSQKQGIDAKKFLSLLDTEDLTMELYKRKPCANCWSWRQSSVPCETCLWQHVRILAGKNDNFKAAK